MRLKSDFGKWDLREGQTKPVLASGFGKWDWQVGSKFVWQVGVRGAQPPGFAVGPGVSLLYNGIIITLDFSGAIAYGFSSSFKTLNIGVPCYAQTENDVG